MKHFKLFGQKALLLVLMVSVLFLNIFAGEQKVIDKTFKAKDLVKIKIISGDCIIKAGSGSEIKVHLVYTFPADKYKPEFLEEGNTLILKEDFQKSMGDCNFQGESRWTVTVPAQTKIEFKAASGDLDITGLKKSIEAKVASGDITAKDLNGNITIKSASGDIDFTNANGEIEIHSASGEINLSKVSGSLEIKAVSGDIEAKAVECKGDSEFISVSGDVEVIMAKTSNADINLKTVSGDVTLNYNGNPVKGHFTFTGKKGSISSDISLESEEISKHNPFVTKYFKKGDSPTISLKTVSGDLRFKK